MTYADTDIVIASAARTAIGNLSGGLASLSAVELGTVAVQAALVRANVPAADVSEVILGQVLTAGAGQNPARQTAIAAGIPAERTAITINQVCGSGLRAVALGAQAIRGGDAAIIVAGGQESMTNAPHVANLRAGVKFGDAKLTDSMIKDGLWDAFNDYHMGITAENVATQCGVTREAQDAYAAQSQQRAVAAIESGAFKDEIAPVTIKSRKGDTIFDTDEFPRAGTTAETLSKLKPAFNPSGTVTAGNASGLNDGAAALVLMTGKEAARRGITPLARIVSFATVGVEPSVMGLGPVPAAKAALAKAGWELGEVDLIEANEAFAAQVLAVGKELAIDQSKLNVNGGAIALGHPIGASGARVLTTLLYAMQKRDVQKGLAALCIGGGMGVAMCVERALKSE